MRTLKIILLTFIGFIFIGCGNPNLAAFSILQKENNVQFKEKDYKDVILETTLKAKDKKQVENHLRFKLQKCLIHWFFLRDTYSFVKLRNDGYIDTKIKTNVWFDINNKYISIHYYTSNFMKSKNRKVFIDHLSLGGQYGNSIYKINLPYSISNLNGSTFYIEINNNENIFVKESLNSLTNKPYKPFLYKISLEEFKDDIIKSITCIN